MANCPVYSSSGRSAINSASVSGFGLRQVCRPLDHPTGGMLCNAMVLEPGLQSLPAVVGGFFAVGGAVIGVEAVGRVGIEHDLARLVRVFERLFHLLDAFNGNAGVGAAIKAEDRRL